ncbi:hypothetical protein R6Q57_014627 [Mikania cordata]
MHIKFETGNLCLDRMLHRGGKYKFERLHPLKKFGQFAEIDDIDATEEPGVSNVFVQEEHDMEAFPEYEDVLTREGTDMDFYFEHETQDVENNLPEQMNFLTTENLVAFLESLGNPPSAPSFTEQEPLLDVAADLVPRKRRRRDPRPAREQVIRSDRRKNVLPENEPIDIVKLQSRVFEIEKDSLSHTLLIQELKTYNELKEKKIIDLETNMGHFLAIQHVKKGFSDMTLAKSVKIKKRTNSLGNPMDIDVYEVKWKSTEWMKKVPILPYLSEGVLDNFNQEMMVDQDHLEDALEFVVYARLIVKNEAWYGAKGNSSTLMIKCVKSDGPEKEKEAEET